MEPFPGAFGVDSDDYMGQEKVHEELLDNDPLLIMAGLNEYGGEFAEPNGYGPNDTFCLVPGRLSLLAAGTRYRVTLDEIRRRIYGPECLNASFLGGILRKAKSKNVGRNLREILQSHGLDLQHGRRKSALPTCFTSLVEEEAHQMARDFGDLIKTYYPQRHAAAYLLSTVPDGFSLVAVRNELIAARCVIRRLAEFHVRESEVMHGNVVNDRSPLNDFDDMTHTFGNTTIYNVICAIDEILGSALQLNNQQAELAARNFFPQQGTSNADQATFTTSSTASRAPSPYDQISLHSTPPNPSGSLTNNTNGSGGWPRAVPPMMETPNVPAFSQPRRRSPGRAPADFTSAQERERMNRPARTVHSRLASMSRHNNLGKPNLTLSQKESLANTLKRHGQLQLVQAPPPDRKRSFSVSQPPPPPSGRPYTPDSQQEKKFDHEVVVHQHLHRGRDGFRYISSPYITTNSPVKAPGANQPPAHAEDNKTSKTHVLIDLTDDQPEQRAQPPATNDPNGEGDAKQELPALLKRPTSTRRDHQPQQQQQQLQDYSPNNNNNNVDQYQFSWEQCVHLGDDNDQELARAFLTECQSTAGSPLNEGSPPELLLSSRFAADDSYPLMGHEQDLDVSVRDQPEQWYL